MKLTPIFTDVKKQMDDWKSRELDIFIILDKYLAAPSFKEVKANIQLDLESLRTIYSEITDVITGFESILKKVHNRGLFKHGNQTSKLEIVIGLKDCETTKARTQKFITALEDVRAEKDLEPFNKFVELVQEEISKNSPKA